MMTNKRGNVDLIVLETMWRRSLWYFQ